MIDRPSVAVGRSVSRRAGLWWCLGTACAVGFCGPSPARAQVAAKDIEVAIAEGVTYLKEQQQPDGTWKEWPGCEGGTNALITLALLQSGESADDRFVRKALRYLRTKAPREKVYAVAMQTLALCAARQDENVPRIVENVRWLEAAQVADGSWAYGGRDKTEFVLGDNSNSQFAVAALDMAERCSDKVRVSQAVWDKTLKYWQASQNPDGSWGYRARGESRGTGSMTCAGIVSTLIAARKRDAAGTDRSAERGLEWLAKNFSAQRNPGHAQAWLLYYLVGLERVGRFGGQTYLGDHDWYREGCEKLLRERDRNEGNWAGVGVDEHHPSVATSMALLFLAQGRRPVLIGKLRYGADDAAWNAFPDDAAGLVDFTAAQWKRELCVQVTDLRTATVADLRRVPILLVTGNKDPKFSDEDCAKLRDYLAGGGTLLADVGPDGKEFAAAIETLSTKRLGPGREPLAVVEEDRSLWTFRTPLPLTERHGLSGHWSGVRFDVLLSNRGAAADWHRAEPARLHRLVAAAPAGTDPQVVVRRSLEFGLNLVSFVTDHKVKYKYEFYAAP